MKTLTAREKKIAVVCAGMIVLYVSFQLVKQSPRWHDRDGIQSIAEQRQILEKNAVILGQSKTIERKYNDYAVLFVQNASEEQRTSAMISDVEAMAGKVNMQISHVEAGKASAREGYRQVSVQIMASGPLLSLIQFVHALQDQPYFYGIEEVQLEKAPDSDDPVVRGKLTFTKAFLK